MALPACKLPVEWAKHTTVYENAGGGAMHAMCNYCGAVWKKMSITRLRAHLSRSSMKGVTDCEKVPDCVIAEIGSKRQRTDEPAWAFNDCDGAASGSASRSVDADKDDSENVARSGPVVSASQTKLTDFVCKVTKENADASVARMLYTSGLSFNVLRNPFFVQMCTDVAMAGKANAGVYSPPVYEAVRTKLLASEVEKVKTELEPFRDTLKDFGCTLVSDGWTNIQGRPLLNILLVSGHGSEFLFSVDCSGDTKTGVYISEVLKKAIEMVGSENVVQVCMDNAANCGLAGRIIEKEFPHIASTPCGAHTVNLMFTDMGKLAWVSTLVTSGKKVVFFVIAHETSRFVLRQYTPVALIKPNATRFGTNFLMLERLYDIRERLEQCTTDPRWKAEYPVLDNNGNLTAAGEFKEIVCSVAFWEDVRSALEVFKPIFVLLKLFDSNYCVTGKVYIRCFNVLSEIQKVKSRPAHQIEEVCNIFRTRWDQLHSRLHAAAYILDPEYKFEPWIDNYEIMDGFEKCVIALFSEDVHDLCINEIIGWKNWKNERKLKKAEGMPTHLWWQVWGGEFPTLRKVAMKVLAQVSSASACERNWSNFAFIHSKSRNRLLPERANDLVYVYANRRFISTAPLNGQKFIPWEDVLSDEEEEHVNAESEEQQGTDSEDDDFEDPE
jgi:Protein of unknown function (DUF 659)/hAT family C-terminal dimerisation region